MNKSLCCISLQLQNQGVHANTMTKKRFLMLERKIALDTISKRILNNIIVCKKTIEYCISKKWNYRISSDLIPLVTLPEANFSLDDLPDAEVIHNEFKATALLIKSSGIRCSMHPDQFVVPASDKPNVSSKSIEELKYHAYIMDMLDLPKSYQSPINIHMNCYKGNLKEISKRFISVYKELPDNIKNRLVLENEDKNNSWSVKELYDYVYSETGIPITYDNLHFKCNMRGHCDAIDAMLTAMKTWSEYRPLFHFSDNIPGNENIRAHADYVTNIPGEYVIYKDQLDLEFEFKAKDYAIEKFEKEFNL